MFLFLIGVAMGCAQPKKSDDYKVVRDEVMQFHGKVMEDQSIIVRNQMKMDTLLKDLEGLKEKFPVIDTAKEAITLKALIGSLARADEDMNDWMHQFEPDVSGKSNDEAVNYFHQEKKKIASIDSLYKKEIERSGNYLKNFNK